ncbi:MAG: adenylosuccinate synthase [Aquificae bacterium]|nr:adenylosuccinate synthase [Aquificota bacterium]
MRKLVVLGAQWGDEGKGKIVDLLSERYELVARFQGGSNAGHTVVANGKKFILHLLPTGALHPHARCVIAQGVVVDLEVLTQEVNALEEAGLPVKERLILSDKAHLVLPYHKLLDGLFEKKKGIGTTLRGVGPAYMFKYARKGIRVCDLFNEKRFFELVEENAEFVKELCEKVFCEKFELNARELAERQLELFEPFKSCVKDASRYLSSFEGRLLFEGAQGTLLDVDAGTYPYVTSSNSSALGLTSGTGLPPRFFADAYSLGISKAYATRVGEGPFPTEAKGEEGELLRRLGNEYGSTTGRPRRCGWLDLVALRYAKRVNEFDGLALTKLDVLDHFDRIKVCVAYRYEGRVVEEFPACGEELWRVEPVYEELPGWRRSTRGITRFEELPEEAKRFIEFVEEFTGVPVVMLSTGPGREEVVWRETGLSASSL